jgi:hypothetical protein
MARCCDNRGQPAIFYFDNFIFVYTINTMKITYDATKNVKNIEERNLNFECVLDFD